MLYVQYSILCYCLYYVNHANMKNPIFSVQSKCLNVFIILYASKESKNT